MTSELFQSHYNPQNPTKTPPTTAQPIPQPSTPSEPTKPTDTVKPTPSPTKTRKAINRSSASA